MKGVLMKKLIYGVSILIVLVLACNKKSNEPTATINYDKYSVTYIQNTPSSAVEFITTYAKYDTVLLEWEPVTHSDIEAGDYRLEYWFWTDAGLTSHKNGHFQIVQSCTVDVLHDLDDLKEGNDGF